MREFFSRLKTRFCSMMADKRRRNRFIAVAVVSAVLIGLATAAAVYLSDYYREDTEATARFGTPADVITYEREDGSLVFAPHSPRVGLIFYPGGKVEHTAYKALMSSCAEWGILCVLVRMPCNLAVLDGNAADRVIDAFPEIESWYIAGHSLGGTMAASYAAGHPDRISGLIMLGAYSIADLSGGEVPVLSVFGYNDGVMNRGKYEECRSNLPEDFTEVVIRGGNHAGFGFYGEQAGDGETLLAEGLQIYLTAGYIAEFINGGEADA